MQEVGADRLLLLLEVGGLLGDRARAARPRDRLSTGQRHEHRRDLVAERAALVVGAHRHRAQHPQPQIFGRRRRGARTAGAARPPTPASTTSLTVPPSAVPDRLHVGERDAHDRQPAVPAGAPVDRRARRDRVAVHHRAHRLRELAALGRARAAARGTCDRTERTISAGSVSRSRSVSTSSCDGLGAGSGVHSCDDRRHVVGCHVEQQRRDVDTRHAVDRASGASSG